MKKMVSVLLAITLVLSSIAVSLTAFTLAAPADEANGADPNLAKDYTHANGAVSWDDAAGAWGDSNIDSKTNSVYGGYSWRFGVPDSTGHITVNATALEADTTYYFSYLYSKDYKVVFEGVQAADGTTVLAGYTENGGTVTYPAGVYEGGIAHGDRSYRVGFTFKTTAAGNYKILLKAGKTWQSQNQNWECTQLSDLVLVKQAAENLLQDAKTGSGISFAEGMGLESQDTPAYALYGGSSWRFNPSVDSELPITVKATLKGNHVYRFAYVYSNDYKVQMKTDKPVAAPDGSPAFGVSYDSQTSPVAVSGGRNARLVSVQFTTGKAGEYTLNLCTKKEWKNNSDNWDFSTLSDLCLQDLGLSENLIADYTMGAGNITFESSKGIWDIDKYGGEYSGYWWKFPYINQNTGFAFNIHLNAADLTPNAYYSFGYTCGAQLYTALDSEKTTGFTVMRNSTGSKNSTAVLKTGNSVENCVITLKYSGEAYEGASGDKWAAAVIAGLNLTRLKGNVTLGVSAQGGGVASISKTSATVGEKVTLTAVPNRLESFMGWYNASGDLLSNEAVFELEAAENLNAVARFTTLNAAAEYSKANGAVSFSSNATVLEADKNAGYYNHSLSWKLGLNGTTAASPAELAVKAGKLAGSSLYEFSFVYSGGYAARPLTVKGPNGSPVDLTTDVKNTVVEGDKHLVSLRFITAADGDYTVTLGACSDWLNPENNKVDSFIQFSDLGLLKIKTILPDGSNLAAGYTSENGAVTWTENAGLWYKDDKSKSLYGGYAWGFGIPETSALKNPAYVTIRATGLDANSNYSFSYYYSEDYVIYLSEIKAANGTAVTDITTPLVTGTSDYATARKVTFDFKTGEEGDYLIVLKMGKGWNNTPNNWSKTVLSDLSLVKQQRKTVYTNLAAYYTNAAGNIGWNNFIGSVKSSEATGVLGYSGYSWSFGLEPSEDAHEIEQVNASQKMGLISVKLGYLQANTTYDFSYKYGKDYLIKLLPSGKITDPSGKAIAYQTPTDVTYAKGDRTHKVSTSFTTKGAGEYTVVLQTCKGAGYRNTPNNWDAVLFGDIRLNYHADKTVTGKVLADVGGSAGMDYEEETMPLGTTVTATATAGVGNSFVGWYNQNGQMVSTQTPYTFTANEDFVLTAKFTGDNIADWNLFAANGMDGTFEESTVPGWYAIDFWEGNDTSWCSFQRTTELAFEGNYSLRLQANHQAVYLPLENLKPNTEYQLSFYINCPGNDEQTKVQSIRMLMDNVQVYASSLNWIKSGTGWHKFSYSFNSGSAENILMQLHMQGYEGNDLMFLDNLSLVQCNPQTSTQGAWYGNAVKGQNGYTFENTGDRLHQVFSVDPQSSYTVSFKAKGNLFTGASEVGVYEPNLNSLLSSQSTVTTNANGFKEYTFNFYSSTRRAVKLFFQSLNGAAEVQNIQLTKNNNRAGSVIEKVDFETDRFALRHADQSVFSIYTATNGNDANVHSGSKSLHFNYSAAQANRTYLFDEAYLSQQVEIGMSYRLKIWYKISNGAAGGKIKLAPEYRGYGSEGVGVLHGAENNGWNELVFTFTSKNFTALKTTIETVLNSTKGSFYIDDIELTVMRPLVIDQNPEGKYAALVYNYIENGNFEDALTANDWGALPSGFTVKTGNAAAGQKYLHAQNGAFYVVPVKVRAGQEYIFAASVRGGANSYVGISATPDGQTLYATANDVPASYLSAGSESWQRKAFSFSSEENGMFYLVIKGAAGGLEVDSIMLYQVAYGLKDDPNDYSTFVPYDYEKTTGPTVILNGGLGLQPAAAGNGTVSSETPGTGDAGLPLAVILLGAAALGTAAFCLTGKKTKQGE